MTPEQLNLWLAHQRYEYPNRPAPPFECPDGYTVSIQASKYHYCSPKQNNQAEYYAVELGFPNQIEEELLTFAEEPEDPLDTVYGFVPMAIVCKILTKHGA